MPVARCDVVDDPMHEAVNVGNGQWARIARTALVNWSGFTYAEFSRFCLNGQSGKGNAAYNVGGLRDRVRGARRPALAVALQQTARGERAQRLPHGPGRHVHLVFFEGALDVRALEPVLAQVLGDVTRDGRVDLLFRGRQRLPRPREGVAHDVDRLVEVFLGGNHSTMVVSIPRVLVHPRDEADDADKPRHVSPKAYGLFRDIDPLGEGHDDLGGLEQPY